MLVSTGGSTQCQGALAGTMEERMLELQGWKRRFINDIITEGGRLPQQVSHQTDDLRLLLS